MQFTVCDLLRDLPALLASTSPAQKAAIIAVLPLEARIERVKELIPEELEQMLNAATPQEKAAILKVMVPDARGSTFNGMEPEDRDQIFIEVPPSAVLLLPLSTVLLLPLRVVFCTASSPSSLVCCTSTASSISLMQALPSSTSLLPVPTNSHSEYQCLNRIVRAGGALCRRCNHWHTRPRANCQNLH